MVKEFSATRTQRRRQTYILFLLGALLLLIAWLIRPNTSGYPVGVLLLGAGMLISSLLNPGRLVIASSLTTAIGVAVFLAFRGQIPGNQIFPAYILALGIGLFAVAIAGVMWAGERSRPLLS